MLISEETLDALNLLLGQFFTHNSEADNFAYNLAMAGYPQISDIYHHSFAHFFVGDEMADGLSNLMDMLDSRAVRKVNNAHEEDYQGNLTAIFADNVIMCEKCRNSILNVIELAELNQDVEVKLYCEELLMKFMPYYKQARIWSQFAQRYEGDFKSFDIHFEDITTYIPIIK